MLELVARPEDGKLKLIDGRIRASAALSFSGEVQCMGVGLGLFKLVRNEDGTVDAKFSGGSIQRVSNLRVDQ